MRVLIVESNASLGGVWQRHLEREGHEVTLATDQGAAISALQTAEANVIVLNVVLPGGSALAVSDYASYRWPEARVVFVTESTFFSDGSIFRHAGNACALLPVKTPPEDLAMMVTHYAGSDKRTGEGAAPH